MIGGPGKPTTIHHERVERTTPVRPIPLDWWDYPQARRRILPLGRRDGGPGLPRGSPRPSHGGRPRPPVRFGPRSDLPHRSTPRRPIDPFSASSSGRFLPRTSRVSGHAGGISLYEIARAIHVTGNRLNGFVRWLHRFAVRPDSTDGQGSPSPCVLNCVAPLPLSSRPAPQGGRESEESPGLRPGPRLNGLRTAVPAHRQVVPGLRDSLSRAPTFAGARIGIP